MGKQRNPFRRLVDSEEGIRNFRSKYNIPPMVGMKYAAQGEWADARQTGEVVIPMIAFIEGGMTIPWVVSLRVILISLGYPPPNAPLICLGFWVV